MGIDSGPFCVRGRHGNVSDSGHLGAKSERTRRRVARSVRVATTGSFVDHARVSTSHATLLRCEPVATFEEEKAAAVMLRRRRR